jgi:hypothetical protein
MSSLRDGGGLGGASLPGRVLLCGSHGGIRVTSYNPVQFHPVFVSVLFLFFLGHNGAFIFRDGDNFENSPPRGGIIRVSIKKKIGAVCCDAEDTTDLIGLFASLRGLFWQAL